MPTPEEFEGQVTLRIAVARYEELWSRYAMPDDTGRDGRESHAPVVSALTSAEVLELLALGEAIARKAGYGRQLAVRAARAAGASWSQIGRALGTSKQSAWETHARWIDQQARRHGRSGYAGLDAVEAARAREVAGLPDEEDAH